MVGFSVADIVQGQPDSTGAIVTSVYSKVVPVYAVYQTAERVMIHFADDPALGAQQRLAIGPLGPARVDIVNGIDELRGSANPLKHLRAGRIEHQLVEPLIAALQGNAEAALSGIEAIRKNLADERASSARFKHLLYACGAVIVGISIAGFMTTALMARIIAAQPPDYYGPLWLAAGAGAVGAFFSVAIAARRRELRVELIRRDNIADALLRIVIGSIAGALLVALMKSGAVSVSIGDAELSAAKGGGLVIMIVAFLAGFLERLVPDMLERTSLTTPASAPPPPQQASIGANELNPRGERKSLAAAVAEMPKNDAPDEDSELDGCLCDAELPDEQMTADVELPEARGGVAEPVTALT